MVVELTKGLRRNVAYCAAAARGTMSPGVRIRRSDHAHLGFPSAPRSRPKKQAIYDQRPGECPLLTHLRLSLRGAGSLR